MRNGQLDASRFAELVTSAVTGAEARPSRAVEALDAAEALWRGRPYLEFDDRPWAEAEAARLVELHVAGYGAVGLASRTSSHGGFDMERVIDRYGALAGLVFIVLAIVGFAIEGSPPGVTDAPGEVVDWYGDNEAQVKAASAISAVGGAAAVLFAAYVAGQMRRRSESGVLAAVAFGGAIVAAAGVGVDSAIRFALADTAGKITPEATQALFAFWDSFFWPMHLGIAITALAVSVSSLESKLIPSWLAGLGIVAGVLILIPVVVLIVIGLIGTALWVAITSVVLLRGSSSEARN